VQEGGSTLERPSPEGETAISSRQKKKKKSTPQGATLTQGKEEERAKEVLIYSKNASRGEGNGILRRSKKKEKPGEVHRLVLPRGSVLVDGASDQWRARKGDNTGGRGRESSKVSNGPRGLRKKKIGERRRRVEGALFAAKGGRFHFHRSTTSDASDLEEEERGACGRLSGAFVKLGRGRRGRKSTSTLGRFFLLLIAGVESGFCELAGRSGIEKNLKCATILAKGSKNDNDFWFWFWENEKGIKIGFGREQEVRKILALDPGMEDGGE